MRHTLVPDLILDTQGAHREVGVTVEDGKIVEVGPTENGERLSGRALAPGFANDHSHAFQRGLRGKVEYLNPDFPHDDFWTWREQMYSLAESLDPYSVHRISERCFQEMLSSGYTRVTEFHYLHHKPDGAPYDDPNELAKAVAEAAESAGLRLLLLPAAYVRGGISRFRDESIDGFIKRVSSLREWAEARPLVEIGVAAHSVRATPREWLEKIGEYAHSGDLPLHIHVDEQPREIEECKKEYGVRPIELLAETGFLGPKTTVVHATHADPRELDLLAGHASSVCACPTTEGNLGDGFLPAEGILRRGTGLSIGSDSQVRVDPLEELREIETNARRLSGRRNVLVPKGEASPTPWLLRAGWQREGILPRDPADFVEIDLDHPALVEIEAEDLSSALVFGAGSAAVRGTWVAGRRLHMRERS